MVPIHWVSLKRCSFFKNGGYPYKIQSAVGRNWKNEIPPGYLAKSKTPTPIYFLKKFCYIPATPSSEVQTHDRNPA
jgi:hypothetical protein